MSGSCNEMNGYNRDGLNRFSNEFSLTSHLNFSENKATVKNILQKTGHKMSASQNILLSCGLIRPCREPYCQSFCYQKILQLIVSIDFFIIHIL